MSPTFRSLRNPNYRLYAAGGIVSNTGTWMQRIAQDWLVLVVAANGAVALGITTALQFLPILLLSAYAGVIADRFPKRRLLQVTQTMMAVPSAVLGVLAVTGVVTEWHVYVLAFIFGIGTAFDAPARQSFVSEMVDEADLSNAVGLNSASFNAARLIGPALAGVLVAAFGGGAVATGWVILINAVSYLAVIGSLQLLDEHELHTPPPRPRGRGALREGLRYVRNHPDLMLVLSVVFFAGTFGLNFSITTALMVTEIYGGDSAAYGLIGSVTAIGSLSGALLAAGRRRVRLRLVVGAGLAFGVVLMVAGVMPNYWSFVVVSPLLGITALTMITAANTRMQLGTDPGLRGRVMALYLMVFMGGTPLGAPLIGWIGATMGARWTLILGGVATIVGILASLLVLGHLRTLRARLRGGVEPGATPAPGAEALSSAAHTEGEQSSESSESSESSDPAYAGRGARCFDPLRVTR